MKKPSAWSSIAGAVLAAALLVNSPAGAAPKGAQQAFPTPEAAAQALHAAARSGDRESLGRILGPRSEDVVSSGNDGEDMAARARFVAAYEEAHRLDPVGARRMELVMGPQEFRFPYPLVRERDGWRFDARSGRAAVLARRIGRNELAAIEAAMVYIEAQLLYSLEAHDGVGPGRYATRIAATPGRHDGLYWAPGIDQPPSPLGPAFRFAAADESREGAVPFHGYFFRVRAGDGRHALVAFPAQYGVTGRLTFVATQDGVVYSRDLGPATANKARALGPAAPGRGWLRQAERAPAPVHAPAMAALAGERGCTLCHRQASGPREAGDAPPPAPAWRDIAARYRGQADTEARLARVVLHGADRSSPHWKDRLEFNVMGGNAGRISPDEARALVRWILATP